MADSRAQRIPCARTRFRTWSIRGSEAFPCAGIVQALAAIEAEYAKPTLRQRSRRETS